MNNSKLKLILLGEMNKKSGRRTACTVRGSGTRRGREFIRTTVHAAVRQTSASVDITTKRNQFDGRGRPSYIKSQRVPAAWSGSNGLPGSATKFSCLVLMLGIVSIGFVCGQACLADELAIKAGKIITIAGDPVEDGVILIRDGRITAIGKDLEIPVDAKVIDATDRVIIPGFVDPHNSSGMSQPNERNTNVPFVSVVDSIDPTRDYFEECRRNGVTTAAVVPGNSTMIGGQAAIVKTAGAYVDDMLLKRFAGIKLSLSPAFGTSRMSHFARLRKELEKARKSIEEKKEDSKDDQKKDKKKKKDESGDSDGKKKAASQQQSAAQAASARSQEEALAALVKLLKQEYPAFIYCDTAMDVGQAFRLIDEYKLKAILIVGRNSYKAAAQLSKRKLPVVLDPTLVYWRTDPRTRQDEKIVLPKIFRDAGVEFVFQTRAIRPVSIFSTSASSPPTLGSSYLWYQAAVAVKYGMPAGEALRRLTLEPAKLLGIDRFVGSIEVGKDADLVILTGDPMKIDTWVDKTIINGKVVYEREKDRKLKRLLNPSVNDLD